MSLCVLLLGLRAKLSAASLRLQVSLHLEPLARVCHTRGGSSSGGPATHLSSNVPQVASPATLDQPPPADADKSYVSGGGNTFRFAMDRFHIRANANAISDFRGKDRSYSQPTQTEQDEPVENLKLRANGQMDVDQPGNDILSGASLKRRDGEHP